MRKLLSLSVVASFALAVGACEKPTPPPEVSVSASQSQETCINVKGTGSIAGTPFPNADGDVVATGPIEGDVEGTLTIKRTPDATDQQGNGATFATYHTVLLETDNRGDFEGTGEANFNFGLFEEGERTDTGVVRINYDGPGDKSGSMKLKADFDLSQFPLIQADYKYNGRLCEGS